MRLEDALDTVYFTSDFHLGHVNILQYCNRPFPNIMEHDECIIQNFNSAVGAYDTVYHLGDFTMGTTRHAQQYIKRLNGKWIFLRGSHDEWIRGFSPLSTPSLTGLYPTVEDRLVSLEFPTSNKDRLVVVLCHYAMRVWDRSHYGSYHLYGHSHGKLLGQGRSMDVGVDAWDFKPVPLRTVLDTLQRGPNTNRVS